jgi:WD40 repeat protein
MRNRSALVGLAAFAVLAGCTAPSNSLRATNTPSPVGPTVTALPSATPTPAPAPSAITAANIAGIQEHMRIGRGSGQDVVWLPDGNIAILYSSGLTVYTSGLGAGLLAGTFVRSVVPENRAVSMDSALSQDGKYVGSLVDYSKVLVWDAETGKILHQFSTSCAAVRESPTHRVAFSRDGTRIAACDEGGVSIWDLSSEKKLNTFPVKNKLPAIVMFSNVKDALVVTSSRDPGSFRKSFADLEVLDISSGKVLAALKSRQWFQVSPIALNRGGTLLAMAPSDGEVLIFDLETLKSVKTLAVKLVGTPAVNSANTVNAIDFSPDDKALVVSSNWYVGASIVDIQTGKVLSQPNHFSATIAKYSPDGKLLAGGWDGYAIYRSGSFAQVAALGDFKKYATIAFDPRGELVAVGDALNAFWDLRKREPVLSKVQPWGWLFGFAPNGSQFVTNDWNGQDWGHKIAAYDRNGSRTEVQDIADSGSNSLIDPPVMSPSSKYVAFGVGRKDIKIVSLYSYQVVADLGPKTFTRFVFSPDDRFIASAWNDVTLWDYTTGKVLRNIRAPDWVFDLAVSPDSTLIAGAVWRQGVLIWSSDTGEVVQRLPAAAGADRVMYSPQGDRIAALGYDKQGHAVVYMLDPANPDQVLSVAGDKKYSSFGPGSDAKPQFAFSPDGSLIAVKGFGDYIEFVDAATGKVVKTLNTFKVRYVDQFDEDSLAFSKDGQFFAAAGSDGIVRIFTVYR